MLVEGEQDAVHVKRELLRIGVVAKMPRRDPAAEYPRDRLVQVNLVANELVPHCTGLVIEFHRSRDEQTAAWQRTVSHSSQFSKSA